MSSILESSDAHLLFRQDAAEDNPTSAEETQVNTDNLKKLLFDDEEDQLAYDEEDSESEIDYTDIHEKNYTALHMDMLNRNENESTSEYGVYQEGEDSSVDSDHHVVGNSNLNKSSESSDLEELKNSHQKSALNGKVKKLKKKELKEISSLNNFRRNMKVALQRSDPLMMDELRFLFVTCGLDERKPGIYFQVQNKVNKQDADRINNLLNDSDDDFELEVVDIVDGISEVNELENQGDFSTENILHEDLLGSTTDGLDQIRNSTDKSKLEKSNKIVNSTLNKTSKLQRLSDEDAMEDDDSMEISFELEHNDKTQTKSNLFKKLIEIDEGDDEDTLKTQKKRGLDHQDALWNDTTSDEDGPEIYPEDQSTLEEERVSEQSLEQASHEIILEKLRNIKGRGASVLAMSLSASNQISPSKSDDDLYESPKKLITIKNTLTESTQFQEEDSSDEDIEESERRHQKKVMELLKVKRIERKIDVSPLSLRTESSLVRKSPDESYITKKRKRIAEETFAKRKELATKFSNRFKKQKASSLTTSVSSSGGFFSSFQKKTVTATTTTTATATTTTTSTSNLFELESHTQPKNNQHQKQKGSTNK